jgi:hypothetical protein
MFVLLVALALGQANPDPVQQQRDQFLAALQADMQGSGKFDFARYEQAKQQVAKLSATDLNRLTTYYSGLKQQVMGQAIVERAQAIALRNQLATTLAVRTSPVFRTSYPAMTAYGPAAGYPLAYGGPLMYGNAALYGSMGAYGLGGFAPGMYGAGVYGVMGPYTGVGPYGTGLYGAVGPGALPAGFGPAAPPGAMGGMLGWNSTFPRPLGLPPY